jgi:hypothetical protein
MKFIDNISIGVMNVPEKLGIYENEDNIIEKISNLKFIQNTQFKLSIS